MGVRRVISCPGGSLSLGAGTEYTSPLVPTIWSPDQADAETRWLAPTYFRGLHIVLDTEPGPGNAWLFEIIVDGLETGVLATISGTNTEGSASEDVVGYAGTDSLVTLRRTSVGTPAGAALIDYGLIVDGVESNISLYGGSPGPVNQLAHLLNPGGWYGSLLTYLRDIIPVETTIEDWTVTLGTAPGTGNSRTFTVWSAAPGTGTPTLEQFSITISDDETEGTIAPDMSYPAGTKFQVIATSSGSPTPSGASWCVRARIDGQDGQSIMSTATDPIMLSTGTGWYYAAGSIVQIVDEALSATTVRAAFAVLAMYIKLFDGTFDGTEWVVMTRKNFADTAAVLNLIGLAGDKGSIEGIEESFQIGDTLDVQVATVNPPTSSGHNGQWSWLIRALSEVPEGVPGPHLWVEMPRVVPELGT